MTRRQERIKQLIKKLTPEIYPTTQIVQGETTVEEYITNTANFFTNELLDRRISPDTLSLFAELGTLLHHESLKEKIPEYIKTIQQDTFKIIEEDISERMSRYTHSMQPTDDEVAIAWLVMEVERLRGEEGSVKGGVT